jgi:hypothetical protein
MKVPTLDNKLTSKKKKKKKKKKPDISQNGASKLIA